MSEQVASDDRFTASSMVSVPRVGTDTEGLNAMVLGDRDRIRVKSHRYTYHLEFDVFEARALRDWLNEVLP